MMHIVGLEKTIRVFYPAWGYTLELDEFEGVGPRRRDPNQATRSPAQRTTYAADFQSPIVFPSGSAIHAKVPVGMVTGPTIFLQPSPSALAMCAATSSTAT